MSLRMTIALASISVAAMPVAFGQLLNPSFETPAVGAQGYQTYGDGSNIGGWVSSGGASLVSLSRIESVLTWWPAPTSGTQLLDTFNSGGVLQSVTLGASTSYSLTFDLAVLGLRDDGHVPSSVGSVLVDVYNDSARSSIVGGWREFSVPLSAGFQRQELDFETTTAGTYILFIEATGPFGTGLDNFSMVVVPEPAEYCVMAGIGLVAWSLSRRARR